MNPPHTTDNAPRPSSSERTFTGGCHCGAVRYAVTLNTDALQALDCDCSICFKKGFVHCIVPPSRFRLLQGQDALTTYRFNTGVARHTFCATCGIHPFYTPRSHPDHVDVNLRTLDDPTALDLFDVEPFHGRRWEDHIDTIRALPQDE